MLLLKLVFYQSYAGFSALAMVLSVFSLVSLVFHARRAQKIWPEIFTRNRNRNARSDTEMTRAVAVPEVPMATAVPAGDVPLPAVPKSPPAPAPAPPPAPPAGLPEADPAEPDGEIKLFRCGACGETMHVRNAVPGAQFECPNCGRLNTI